MKLIIEREATFENNSDMEVIRYDQDSYINTTVYVEMLTSRPHDTSVQKATSDNENLDAV